LRSGGVWSQSGKKFLGSGAVSTGTPGSGASQGNAVALSSDGRTAVLGGLGDDSVKGAAWPFVLNATPAVDIVASGNAGGPFTPASFDYKLYATTAAAVDFTITGVPDWLTVSPSAGTIPLNGSQVVTFSVNGTAAAKAGGTYGPTTITLTGAGVSTINATLTVEPPHNVTLASAVLPSSRSVQVGTAATAFMTVINTSGTTGVNCGLGLGSEITAGFKFQTTDPVTNAPTGAVNAPTTIAAGGARSFVFSVTPSAAFAPTDVAITAGCSNGSAPAPSVVGLNTLLLSASATPVADIIALAATATNDGIVNIPGDAGTGAFAVATFNVGASVNATVTADTGAATLPVIITLCQTNPSTGQCLTPPGAAIPVTIASNATPTFAVFVQGTGNVAFDPANKRVFLRFKDAGGVTRGATSVAVRTQ